MKFFVAVAFCFTIVAVLADYKEEVRAKLKTAHKKCQADPSTAVDEEALKAFLKSKGEGTAPANLGKHSLCITKTLGMQNADGTINEAHLREKLSENVQDPDRVDKFLAECAVQKDNEIATAEHLFKCFFKHVKAEHHN